MIVNSDINFLSKIDKKYDKRNTCLSVEVLLNYLQNMKRSGSKKNVFYSRNSRGTT